jgi:hypothetical protein
MYSDYSFCQAVKYLTKKGAPSWAIQLIYDISCSWFKNFLKRVEENDTLVWDEKLELIVAVGKWHLANHVDGCFVQHSLNFMKGAGHVDGEIMETVWSQLNGPATTARSMTAGHRRAALNIQIADMNFKKLIAMGINHFMITFQRHG